MDIYETDIAEKIAWRGGAKFPDTLMITSKVDRLLRNTLVETNRNIAYLKWALNSHIAHLVPRKISRRIWEIFYETK